MRSRLFPCVALAAFAFIAARAPAAHAADPKAKPAKKKGDELSDDKSGIGKTLQWEDKVMGPDDKGAELDKIRKAQAIHKAAAEKAERDKAANAAREAKEKEAAAKAGPTTTKRGGDVALPTLPDEGPGAGKGKAQHTEISPKLDTAAAAAPPPVLKPADDKFIDKLLKEEPAGKRKKAASSDDKALIDMLASEKPGKAATTGKKGRKDGVDDLLTEAEKAAPMPETKVRKETPEWAKPEIRESAPAPAPIAAPKPAKRDDGIIRVVQGAAGSTSGTAKPAVATTTTMRNPPPPPGSGTRKQAAAVNSRPGEWADPFSDPPSRKGGKQVAAKRQVVQAEEEDVRPPPTRRAAVVAPPPATAKREASRGSNAGDWADPFSDGDRKSTGTRRAAPTGSGKSTKGSERPAHPAGWKDPFTSDDPPASKPARTVVATREPVKHDSKKLSVTPTATHRVAAAPAEAPAPAQGRWGVLKKRR